MLKRKLQVPPDLSHEDISDRETSMPSEKVLKMSEHVDASPFNIPNEEYESSNSSEIQTETSGTSTGRTTMMPDPKHAERYNMGHPNRGICLVFNHEKFDSKSLNREGSNVDASRIETTFRNLGFEVVVHDNLECSDIMAKIKTLSEFTNHKDNDCVCIFVLTHGLNNDFLMGKDFAYSSNRIWTPFTADKCPSLAGKPKLFFFQACRGDQSDGGIHLVERSGGRNDNQADRVIASYTIPTLSDFLIAHSTTFGCDSNRHAKRGTWYVQSLCDVLDEELKSKKYSDFLKILTMTARKVATDFQLYYKDNPDMNMRKQIPSVTSTLIRNLYFTPKQ